MCSYLAYRFALSFGGWWAESAWRLHTGGDHDGMFFCQPTSHLALACFLLAGSGPKKNMFTGLATFVINIHQTQKEKRLEETIFEKPQDVSPKLEKVNWFDSISFNLYNESNRMWNQLQIEAVFTFGWTFPRNCEQYLPLVGPSHVTYHVAMRVGDVQKQAKHVLQNTASAGWLVSNI